MRYTHTHTHTPQCHCFSFSSSCPINKTTYNSLQHIIGRERCHRQLLYASTDTSLTSKSKQRDFIVSRGLSWWSRWSEAKDCHLVAEERQINKQQKQDNNGRFSCLMTIANSCWGVKQFCLKVFVSLSPSTLSSTDEASFIDSVKVPAIRQTHTSTEDTHIQNWQTPAYRWVRNVLSVRRSAK